MYILSTMQAQNLLTEAQYTYVAQKINDSYTQFFEQLITSAQVQQIQAVDIALTEEELHVHDWRLIDAIDYGKNNRQGKCACGISLRYEYIIEHTKTGKRIHYGKDHLATFLNMPKNNLKMFQQNVQFVKDTIDELFFMIEQGEQSLSYYLQIILDAEQYNALHDDHPLTIPYDAKEQLAVGLPLLKTQRNLLDEAARYLENEKRIAAMKQLAHHYVPVQQVEKQPETPSSVAPTITIPNHSLPLQAQLIILMSDGIKSALTMAHLIYHQSDEVLDVFSIYDLRRPPIYGQIVSTLLDLEAEGIIKLSHSPVKTHLDCFAQFV